MAVDPLAWTFLTGSEPSEQWTWLTDLPQAPTGVSQHRRLRRAPRVSLKFNGLEQGLDRRRLEALLFHRGGEAWQVPIITDQVTLTSPLAGGSETIPVAVGARRFGAGHALLLGDRAAAYELVQVESVAVDAIALAAPTVASWPAGTRLVPARRGRLAESTTLSRFTADATPYTVTFALEEALESPPDPGSALYRSQPVIEWRPVWLTDPIWEPMRELTTEDNAVGTPVVFDLPRRAMPQQTLPLCANGPTAIAALRGLLAALAGRWSVAWVPTWAADLRPVAGIAAGGATLDVEGPVLSLEALASNRRDLRIELHDGTVHYRRVSAVSTPALGVDRLTLDAPFVEAISASDIALISFMALCQQDTDVNLMRYWDRDVVLCDLSFKAVIHDL